MAPPSVAVIRAIADAEGVEPTDLERVLVDVVDPQALDSLFDGREQTDGEVRFAFHGYDVWVTSDHRVDITARTH